MMSHPQKMGPCPWNASEECWTAKQAKKKASPNQKSPLAKRAVFLRSRSFPMNLRSHLCRSVSTGDRLGENPGLLGVFIGSCRTRDHPWGRSGRCIPCCWLCSTLGCLDVVRSSGVVLSFLNPFAFWHPLLFAPGVNCQGTWNTAAQRGYAAKALGKRGMVRYRPQANRQRQLLHAKRAKGLAGRRLLVQCP